MRAINSDNRTGDRLEIVDGKVVAIQLMRAIAASWVAFAHLAWGFAENIENGLSLPRAHPFVSESAVALFFVVSGYVMVTSSQRLFGTRSGPVRFWLRRIIRIMPPYWIASLFMAAIFILLLSRPVDAGEFGLSLALIPYWSENGGLKPMPFLWPGWTLFYEMAFYALFGLMLVMRRRRALTGVVAALVCIAAIGLAVPPDNPVLFTLTRSIVLIFIAGIALAVWRQSGRVAPEWLRWLAGLASIPALIVLIAYEEPLGLGTTYTFLCGIPAGLLGFALLSGPLSLRAPRTINALGNMSYALYLLHVPIAWGWQWFYRRLPGFDPGPWDYLATVLVVTFTASWLFYLWIERPMTRSLTRLALNQPSATPHERQSQI